MKIALGENVISTKNPITALKAAEQLSERNAETALAFYQNGRLIELSDIIDCDSTLIPVTYADEEGRRIYERSLRFVFLLAVSRVLPSVGVRLEFSQGHGVYGYFRDTEVSDDTLGEIESEMRRIVSADLPFSKEIWSKDEAIRYFTSLGQKDKIELLRYREYQYFTIYRCGELCEYFYGAMLPSTGRVKVFSLVKEAPGFLLLSPSPSDPSKPAPFIHREKNQRVFRQSARWCEILGCVNAADLNRMITSGNFRDFIRVNEALHDKQFASVADLIVKNNSRLVLIAGPSSSGKTTSANRLCIHLRVCGLRPVLISMDDFYIDRDALPIAENGHPDLETIEALDLPLLGSCVERLLAGETVDMPRFDFTVGKRSPKTEKMHLTGDQPIVMEGIHALNPELLGNLSGIKTTRLFVSALTCLNLDDHNRIRTTDVRLMRRIVRDSRTRNASVEDTLRMWTSVRAGEDKWIFPYQENADVFINTALHYELPFLKRAAYKLLAAVPPASPYYVAARRLIKTLNYFVLAPEDTVSEIPPISILREFIGGNTLYI